MESIQLGPALVAANQYVGLPVTGRLACCFDWAPSTARGGHTGIDIAAPPGSPVLAPAPGRIAATQQSDGPFGTYVLLDHGDEWISLYAHLARIDAGVGTILHAGERIGLSGCLETGAEPGLHWGLSYQSTPLVRGAHLRDPLKFIAAAPDRLDRERLYEAVAHGVYGVLQAAGVALGTKNAAGYARYHEGSPEWEILAIQRAARRLIARYATRNGE